MHQRVNIDRVLGVEGDKFNKGGLWHKLGVHFSKLSLADIWSLFPLNSIGNRTCDQLLLGNAPLIRSDLSFCLLRKNSFPGYIMLL